MTQTFTQEIRALTATGTIIRSFDDPELAWAWMEDKGEDFPGCSLVTFTRTVTESSTPLRRKLKLVRAA